MTDYVDAWEKLAILLDAARDIRSILTDIKGEDFDDFEAALENAQDELNAEIEKWEPIYHEQEEQERRAQDNEYYRGVI